MHSMTWQKSNVEMTRGLQLGRQYQKTRVSTPVLTIAWTKLLLLLLLLLFWLLRYQVHFTSHFWSATNLNRPNIMFAVDANVMCNYLRCIIMPKSSTPVMSPIASLFTFFLSVGLTWITFTCRKPGTACWCCVMKILAQMFVTVQLL